MRTPLNGILGLTNLMKDSTTDPNLLHDVSQMEISGKYLLNLINDTLDMSRIENGKLELHPAVCDRHMLFHNILGLIEPEIEAKQLTLRVDDSQLYSVMLYVDSGRIEQILMNLLGNAVKFTPPGGTIEFAAENITSSKTELVEQVIIRDTGIGMDAAFLPHVFEPFSQADPSKTSTNTGTGLGMAITKQIVEQMGGKISVESQLGKGTSFTIVLPMPLASDAQIEQWKQALNQSAGGVSLKGRHILLCEDHPINTEIAKRLLERKDMIVEHAENGQIGVDMFEKAKDGYYDAVLMDIRMPVMDGLEATRRIRALGKKGAATVPIIAMTANAFENDIQNAKAAGVSAYLSKPIDPEKLWNTLEAQMAKRPG